MRTLTVDLDGPVNYADFGGTGPTIVLVHGLGGSHANWLAVGPALALRARVLAPDLAGFGRTPPAGRSCDVRSNRALLDRFIDEIAGGPVTLVGNSMGGLLSLMEAALRKEKVHGLVLVDPALPRAPGARPDAIVAAAFAAYAVPGIGERFVTERARRLGPAGMVRETMRLCCVDPTRIPPEVVEAHVALATERMETMPWATRSFLQAARSLLALLAQRRRIEEIVAQIVAPTLIVHGARDRLVSVTAARALALRRPDWTLRVLDNVGHTPQLEAPDLFVDTVVRWLDDHEIAEAREV